MIRLHVMIAMVLALAVGTTGPTRAAAPVAAAPATISAFTAADLRIASQKSERDTGCSCAFTQSGKTFAQVIGYEFIVRTPAGLQTCPIIAAQFTTMWEKDDRSLVCGGRTISFKSIGKPRQAPGGGYQRVPTLMTVTVGGKTTTIRGDFGCIC